MIQGWNSQLREYDGEVVFSNVGLHDSIQPLADLLLDLGLRYFVKHVVLKIIKLFLFTIK